MVSLILRFEFPANEWFTSNQRLHWAEKYKRSLLVQQRVRVIALSKKNQCHLHSPIFQKCHATVFVAYPSRRRFDPSNTSAIVKPIIDELTRCGYWVDDDSTHLIGPDYRPADHVSRPNIHEITLKLEEVS